MSQNVHVLVVEDERDIADLIALHLSREGYKVTQVINGEEALQKLLSHSYQLVLLDWMLPGLSGLDMCKKLRASVNGKTPAQVPILMVTARVDPADIILGLEMGADDYLTKPFEIPILLARVRALLRRSLLMPSILSNRFQLGKLFIDAEKYELTCAGKPVQLTKTEFHIILNLLRNQGRVLTREQLIDLVRGEDITVIDRTIDTHVFGLRKKLGSCADVVETVRGVGYRIKNQDS